MIYRQSIGITIFAIMLLIVSGTIFLMFSPILIPEVKNSLKITIMKQTQQALAKIEPIDYKQIKQFADTSERDIKNDAIR